MDDEELLQRFETAALSREEWTHRTHIRIAFLYVTRYPFNEALDKIRRNIKALNARNAVPEGPQSGYNETITVAFLTLVASTQAAYGRLFPAANSQDFCERHPHLLQKTVLRLFYSPERRGHPEAKTRFIEPDLASLPLVQPTVG